MDDVEMAVAIGDGRLIAKNSVTQYSRFSTDYRGINGSQIPIADKPLDVGLDVGDEPK